VTRVCPCPRKCSMEGKRSDAKWASEACAKRWQREHPGLPLSAAYSSDVSPTKRKRSGLQVTRDKAVAAAKRAVFLFTGDVDPDLVQECVEREVNRELSVHQRAQLHAREQRKAA
jgi:hypothetical protein